MCSGQRFIPSDFGSDYEVIPRGAAQYEGFAQPKLAIHEAVRQSGLGWTFIAKGWFAEVLFGPPLMGVDMATRTVTAPGSFDTSTTVTALGDIGRLTAAAIIAPATRDQQLYFGRQYTFEQIAQALEQATGEKVTRKVRSLDDLQAALASNPTDMSARFALSLLQTTTCNSFPEGKTYKQGEFSYTPLESAIQHMIRQTKPSL